MNLATQVIKPRHCTMLFGVPTTWESHWRHLRTKPENQRQRDFVPNLLNVWARYEREIVIHVNKVLPWIRAWGVRVVENATMEDFCRAFQDEETRVVILFSHWKQDTVEFDDGLWDISEIVSGIPHSFVGFIDLTICHPENLAFTIERDRPGCLTRYINIDAYPVVWMNYLLVVSKIDTGGEP
jgi:hypothetical protein